MGKIASIRIQLLEWYHLAVTFDGTNFVFYINGARAGEPIMVWVIWRIPGAQGHIGTGVNVGFNPFDGGVDEAAIYGYALTPAQILAHYEMGTNSFRRGDHAAINFLSSSPSAATNYSGTPATFSATANGTTPLHYPVGARIDSHLPAPRATPIPSPPNSRLTMARILLRRGYSMWPAPSPALPWHCRC